MVDLAHQTRITVRSSPARMVTPPPAPESPTEEPKRPPPSRIPSVLVGVVIAAVTSLSIYYLVRGEPLLVQGEVDATRFDIAARVDGRVGDVPVVRGQNVQANAVLVRIDNPETIAKHEQAVAAKLVAEAQLANINVGTRATGRADRRERLGPVQKCM